MSSPDFVGALSRALVIGVFGGTGLVLTQLYSRRGPLIYPVYAALLAALALSLARVNDLLFVARFVIALSATFLATAMMFVVTVILGRRARKQLIESGRPFVAGHVPTWGLPLLLLILIVVSAGVAHVSS